MSKHTPGPWAVEFNSYGTAFVYGGPATEQTSSTGVKYRAIVCGGDNPATLKRDDARLIAAAPEMLQALKWAEEHAAESEAGRDDAWYQNLAKLEAVIAKAEGRNV